MRTGICVPGGPGQRDRRGARRDPGVPETGTDDSRTPESAGLRGRRMRAGIVVSWAAEPEGNEMGPGQRHRGVPGTGTAGQRTGIGVYRAAGPIRVTGGDRGGTGVSLSAAPGPRDRAARGRPRRCRACRGFLRTGRDGGGEPEAVPPPPPCPPPRTCPPPRRCHVRSLFSPQPRPAPSHWSVHDISDDVTHGTGEAAVHWRGEPCLRGNEKGRVRV